MELSNERYSKLYLHRVRAATVMKMPMSSEREAESPATGGALWPDPSALKIRAGKIQKTF